MSNLRKMISSMNRWRTNTEAGVEVFAPYLDTPCAINRKEAGVDEEAADSGIFRFAPAVLPDSNGIMRRHEGLAKYMPKKGYFQMHVQEKYTYGVGNYLEYGDGFLGLNDSDKWAAAKDIKMDATCVPHCERLAFIANIGSPSASEFKVRGWFRGGGNQENECPLQGYEMMYGRLWGQGICDSLRVKTINSQNVQENRMPLPQGDVLLNDAFPLPGGTSQIDHSEVQPPFGRNYGTPPPVSDCYVDSESWGGWCPSLLARQGDFVPSTKNQQINLDGWDKRANYGIDGNGNRVYGNWQETPESLAGAYDLVLDGSSLALSWDWRMFYAFVSRNYRASSRGYASWQRTWDKMYWDIGTKLPMPSGVVFDDLVDELTERAWASEKPIVDKGTVFDVRIQAMVYSFKVCAEQANSMKQFPAPLVLWDKMGYAAPGWVYLWSHTNLDVKVRQAMPLTA